MNLVHMSMDKDSDIYEVMDMEQILMMYYADNAKNLHRLVDKILLKFN